MRSQTPIYSRSDSIPFTEKLRRNLETKLQNTLKPQKHVSFAVVVAPAVPVKVAVGVKVGVVKVNVVVGVGNVKVPVGDVKLAVAVAVNETLFVLKKPSWLRRSLRLKPPFRPRPARNWRLSMEPSAFAAVARWASNLRVSSSLRAPALTFAPASTLALTRPRASASELQSSCQ